MKEVKPVYYDQFQCTADKCTFTCCQEWKISVDSATEEKWISLFAKQKSVSRLNDVIEEKDGIHVIKLNEEKKCPFLNKNGLCNLVIQHGEELLSKTCDTFPRQIHEYVSIGKEKPNRTEYSLVTCCPAVIDLWRESNEINFVETDDGAEEENILFTIRNHMITIMNKDKKKNELKFMMLFYIIKELQEQFGESLLQNRPYREQSQEVKDFCSQYDSIEVQDHIEYAINHMNFSLEDTFYERNEIFLDMLENYKKEGLYKKYVEEIYEFAEKLSTNEAEIDVQKEMEQFLLEMKDYSKLFQNFMVSDIYTNILIPMGDFESMIVMLQWLALEYVVLMQAVFLHWISHGKGKISYETIREYMVVCARITGYDQDDIYEYLENSFEELQWDFGYLALIMGNLY